MRDFVKVSTALSGRSRRSARALIALTVLLPTACSTPRPLLESRTSTDTVTVTERVRDTVVIIDRDEAMVRALVECDSMGRVRMTELTEYRAGSRLRPPTLQLRDNILTATAISDSIAIYLQIKDRYEQHKTAREASLVQTVEVNRLTGWQKMWMRAGQILAIALLVFGVFKIRRL